jgi:hypothetical protein
MKSDERKLNKLMSYQIDTGIAKQLVDLGYSVSKLRNASISELQSHFEKEQAQQIKKALTRQPIPEDILIRLMDECDWKCCICWNIGKIDPVIVHHIIEHSKTQDNSYNNLVVLCLNHHADAHTQSTLSGERLPSDQIRIRKKDFIQAIAEWKLGKRPPPGEEWKIQILDKFPTFHELAHQIWPLLTENARAFGSFGPNSGAESAAPVRWNMELWDEAKIDIILPNNRKIKELIENNWNIIPEKDKPVFKQMISHIYAFEKHCNNPMLNYTEHQFPQAFAKIIDDICSAEIEKGVTLNKIESWLLIKFKEKELPLVEAYLIGSILRGIFEGADVDIFLLLNNITVEEIKNSGNKLIDIKQQFLLEFGLPLHAIVFSQPEKSGFYEFLENLTRKKLVFKIG